MNWIFDTTAPQNSTMLISVSSGKISVAHVLLSNTSALQENYRVFISRSMAKYNKLFVHFHNVCFFFFVASLLMEQFRSIEYTNMYDAIILMSNINAIWQCICVCVMCNMCMATANGTTNKTPNSNKVYAKIRNKEQYKPIEMGIGARARVHSLAISRSMGICCCLYAAI